MAFQKISIDIRPDIINNKERVSDCEIDTIIGNGTEFADYANIKKLLNGDFYFAHPYSSWERGLNENTNGPIRQYIL